MGNIILAIDQGTTSTRVVLIDANNLDHLSSHQIELQQHYPKPSYVEHDLNDIWRDTLICIEQSIKKNSAKFSDIVGIGITNQRETTCAFDKQGNPLAKAIVWQDKRTSEFCHEQKNHNDKIKNITGLPLDPYFSASKMRWLLQNNNVVTSAAKNNSLHFGTIDTFLLYKLSNGSSFKTDASNASRTQLLNLKTGSWDKELLNFFNLQESFLPQVQDTFSQFGVTQNISVLPDGIPIYCMIGDQQSALLGQHCTMKGMSKCTYGTGAFFLLNTGEEIKVSSQGLLSTIAYRHDGKNCFALEGASFIAGAGVQWFRDQIKGISKAPQIEDEANKVLDLSRVKQLFFFPFFSGLGSPYWKSDALASIYGMSRDTGIPELSYALLDGLAQSITDLKEAAEIDLNMKLKSFHVDGGACKNNLLMQMQANYNQIEIRRPKQVETTVSGAALGVKLFLEHKHPHELAKVQIFEKTFQPQNDLDLIERRKQWNRLLKRIYL
jgi:glycerol kinase